MKYVIGVVGENGAGKDTFTTFFKAAATPFEVTRLKFSDVLFDTLKLWGIETSRSNLQNLAIIMDREYGKGSLTRATRARTHETGSDIVIIEGVRWKSDVPMIRTFKNSFLVYITASADIRFERMKARGEKAGEAKITREQFEREEKAGTELEIPEIGKNADFVIENNGSLEDLRKKVEQTAIGILK